MMLRDNLSLLSSGSSAGSVPALLRLALALLLLTVPLSACAPSDSTSDPKSDSASDSADAAPSESESEPGTAADRDLGDAVVVAEAWQSAFHEPDNIDSVDFWQGPGPDGETVAWVVATGKESHDLVVYDAAGGETVRRVGGEGDGPGQFRRPNGVMIHGDLVLVAERDNHRLQVLRLPGFETVGLVGADALRRPYGLTVFDGENGAIEVYVTDNYETVDPATGEGEIPPAEELGERVKHFRLADAGGLDEGAVTGELVRAFGDTEGEGVLTKVETILADPDHGVLLIADEETRVHRVYDLEGAFTGRVVGEGRFHYEPEGVALRRCAPDAESTGYWIATDQRGDTSFFRVLARDDFEYLGTFVGELTANTDGVAQTTESFPGFPGGAFFAVHDDQGVTGFDWRKVAESLRLGC